MKEKDGDLSRKPLKLAANRVWRTYKGGKLLEAWQGLPEAHDSSFPEEWIASVVSARNAGREHKVEGLSQVRLEDGKEAALKDLIDADPEAFLGRRHASVYGSATGVLVKALDSGERLTVQVHPDRTAARDIFQSPFGKTEAWYILGGREVDGEAPYVLYGFKPGMTRDKWEALFREQDTAGMLESLHKIEVKPGQVFLVEGGMPHAIGSGCFLIEIQEPTDLTIRVERTTPGGSSIPDFMCHQGAGFERMFDCFHYETYTLEQVMEKFCLRSEPGGEVSQGVERELISYSDTPYFALTSLDIETTYSLKQQEGFSILVGIAGSGTLRWDSGRMDMKGGEQIFLPAGVKEVFCERVSAEPWQVVRCFPPQV